jgi:hypothetical protein
MINWFVAAKKPLDRKPAVSNQCDDCGSDLESCTCKDMGRAAKSAKKPA